MDASIAHQIPEWIGTALLGAVIAALGYVAKLAVEGLHAWRHERASQLSRLLELASLLHASRAAFRSQRQLVTRLEESLRAGQTLPSAPDQGFERLFSDAHEHMSDQQRELHSLIRSMTEHSILPLNVALSAWLAADLNYRTARGAQGMRGELAGLLNQLDTHLRLWHAKYQGWIPGHPRHALVYLADEERHGLGFPHGLDELVDRVLRDMDANLAPKISGDARTS